jgi:hypothetical protein
MLAFATSTTLYRLSNVHVAATYRTHHATCFILADRESPIRVATIIFLFVRLAAIVLPVPTQYHGLQPASIGNASAMVPEGFRSSYILLSFLDLASFALYSFSTIGALLDCLGLFKTYPFNASH